MATIEIPDEYLELIEEAYDRDPEEVLLNYISSDVLASLDERVDSHSPPVIESFEKYSDWLVLTLVEIHEPIGWDALLDYLPYDDEDLLDETMDDLARQDVIRYSGKDRGYILVEDVDPKDYL